MNTQREESLRAIAHLSRRLLLIWMVISLISIPGLVRAHLLRGQLSFAEGSITPLTAGGILILGMLGGLVWDCFWRAPQRSTRFREGKLSFLSSPRVVPGLLFFKVQILAGCLAAAAWLNLRLLSPSQTSKLHLVVWVICSYAAAFGLFLIVLGKDHFAHLSGSDHLSMRGAAALLFSQKSAILFLSFTAAVLVGLVADGWVLDTLESRIGHSAGLNLFAVLGVGLPFFVFDLILLVSAIPLAPINRSTPVQETIALHPERKGRDGGGRPSRRSLYSFLSHPLSASFLSTLAFYAIFLLIFRPGYETDDDIGIITLASGYLNGKPTPFLVFSNILWGFILKPLYEMHTRINWEILLFILLNFLSVWALVYLILSRPIKRVYRLFGALVVLLCDVYFLLNINFTTIAAFASISGFCLILMAVQSQETFKVWTFVPGAVLVLIGSLIRIESMLLILAMILPSMILSYRSFHLRNLVIALAITGILVSGCYAIDRVYVRSSPDWYAFEIYNRTRSMLHDTPRLAYLEGTYREVGWSENDLVMFIHWFFPDPKTYSLENLRYLVAHVPDKKPSLVNTLIVSLGRLVKLESLPYLLIIVSTWLGISVYSHLKRATLPILVTMASLLGINVYLVWTQKLPLRVLLPLLAFGAIFELFILEWMGFSRRINSSSTLPVAILSRLRANSIVLSMLVAVGLILAQALEITGVNKNNQIAYQQILADIKTLQVDGRISSDALIISPARGIPLEWSNPLILEFPEIRYLDLGWLTFSPVYDDLLREFEVQSIPTGLYQKNNLYLMTPPNMMFGVLTFIREHEGVDVKGEGIYRMPNTDRDSVYTDITLYKIEQKK